MLEVVIPPIVVTPTVIDGAGWAAIIAAVAVLVTSITGLVVAFRTKRDLAVVHTLVNAKSDNQLARIDQLADTLNDAGVTIPQRPAPLPVPPTE